MQNGAAAAQRFRVASNGTVILNGAINANGSIGTAGQVLTSNGTIAYWSAASSAGSRAIAMSIIFG
jgi:hypothetical protein